jgi:F-type H+-transporting ATPase subunit delta
MPTSGVARRYARAVFEIAQEENNLDGWLRDLRTIRDVLLDPTLGAFLQNPSVPTEQKLRMVDNSVANLGTKQRNFVGLLIEKRRTSLIDEIVAAFEDQLDDIRGVVHARVTTAVQLTEEEASIVTRGLDAYTGRHVIVATTIDPAILGGFVARIGDRLIDASIVGRLNALRESLIA